MAVYSDTNGWCPEEVPGSGDRSQTLLCSKLFIPYIRAWQMFSVKSPGSKYLGFTDQMVSYPNASPFIFVAQKQS
jgi:hypothetical protein